MPERRRFILCLVTDRRRLASRLQRDPTAMDDYLVAQAGAAADAGVDLVQIREADVPAAVLTALTRRIVARVGHGPTRVLVNDRLDVALAAGAGGVHLKATSIPPSRAREMAPPGWWIGASVHGPAATAPAGVDYLIAGTVKASASKPAGTPLLGFDGLRGWVAAASPVPVLGIGGLSERDVPHLVRAGAAGLAAIDAFLPGSTAQLEESVQRAVARLRSAFDSSVDVS